MANSNGSLSNSKCTSSDSRRKPGRPATNTTAPMSGKSVGFKLDHDWQSSKTLGQCNDEMLRHGILADVTFSVGVGKKGEKIRAHKYVLASRSTVFFVMFCGNNSDMNDGITVGDIEPDIFNKILRYIYTDEVEITTRNVTALLYAAKKYSLQELVALCSRKLSEGISVQTVSSLLEQAHRYKESELQENCLQFIYKNAHAVLATSQFHYLCSECLTRVIESDELRADETKVYEAVYEWSTKACKKERLPVNSDSRNRVLGKIKYLIRFPVLDMDFFTNVVSNQGLLTKDETIAIFQYLHSRTSPNVGSFITRRRAITRALRYETTSGAWNVGSLYCDAIQFQCSNDVTLDGVSVYGCYQGEAYYDVSVRVLNHRHELLVKTDAHLLTHEKTEMYDVLLNNGVTLKAMTWYTIVLYMEGPQTKRGLCGKNMVYCEKVQFFFKTSVLTQNCTTEREGQIPAIIFH